MQLATGHLGLMYKTESLQPTITVETTAAQQTLMAVAGIAPLALQTHQQHQTKLTVSSVLQEVVKYCEAYLLNTKPNSENRFFAVDVKDKPLKPNTQQGGE